jgi:8-oxo-dGTP pyrophosphatase MutT (NUDIX family)
MELCDIYDEHCNKTGRVVERGTRLDEGEHTLFVDVWIVNRAGEFLMSRRAPNIKHDPDKWEPTCGGVSAGEDSRAAGLREAREELGVTLAPENGVFFTRFNLRGRYIIEVWLYRQEVDISTVVIQPEEVTDARWMTPGPGLELIENDQFMQATRVPYVRELFDTYETL